MSDSRGGTKVARVIEKYDLSGIGARLETAWTGFERQRAHRQQTDRYRRQRRRLVAALLVLGLVVVILALVLVLS